MNFVANIPERGPCRVSIERGVIANLQPLARDSSEVPFCAPGFVDLQINGFAGVDFADPGLDAVRIRRLLTAVWATGCTTFLPTLITNSRQRLIDSFRQLEALRREVPEFDSSVPCYHLEGPYLSAGPSHGAHDPQWMRDPDWSEFAALQEAAGGRIGLVTLAPERKGALDFIRRLRESGIVAAIGHTDGRRNDILAAAVAGATLCTHLGNGCPAMIHRHDAPLWAQLDCDELAATLICDGHHLPPGHIRLFRKAKGAGKCALVTDAIHVAGCAPGTYTFGNLPVELLETGKVVSADRSSMAGSTLAMNRAIDLYREATNASLAEALECASTVPARILGRRDLCRSVAPGEPANLLLFEMQADRIAVRGTIVGGNLVSGTLPND